MMHKYIKLTTVLFFLSCNLNQQNANLQDTIDVNYCKTYPAVVDSLKVKDLYDSARWYIYTKHCDLIYDPVISQSAIKTFGELSLEFKEAFVKNDTLLLLFTFLDNGDVILPSMTKDNRQLATGLGFNINTRKKMFMISSNTYFKDINSPHSRYENPLQPEVLNYIKSNWNRLDSCFKELAAQKGIEY